MSETELEDEAPPSLDGPRAKLNRAKLHLEALHESIVEFRESESHGITTEVDAESGKHTMRLQVYRRPLNPYWGLLIGDFAHNLRSALDHLVWQLVRLNQEVVPLLVEL